MKGIIGPFTLLLVLFSGASITHAQPKSRIAPWVTDKRFNAVFDMYWRAMLLGRYAGNRVCALKDRAEYDNPLSPYRPLDQRLNAASNRFEKLYPRALNTVARPYMMPPSQMNCDDQRSAWESIFAFETAVTAFERLLDNIEVLDAQKRGNK